MQPIGIVILSISILLYSMQAGTAGQSQINTAWSKGLTWLVAQQTGEGGWKSAPGTEMITAALAVESFVRAGVQNHTYSRAVSYVANTSAYSVDARARQAIALHKAGMNVTASIATLINMRNSNLVWGAYAGYAGSFPDTALAFSAINLTGTSYPDLGLAMNYMINSQNNDDGGWSYIRTSSTVDPLPNQSASAVVPTAYNLIALAPISGIPPTTLNNAIAWLKSKQKENGSFGTNTNGTIYETAVAYAAIVAVAGSTDPAAENALQYLIDSQNNDGSWAGDALQTALVLTVLPLPSTTPTVTQNPNMIPGNGQNTSAPATSANLGVAMATRNANFTLTTTNGAGPHTWKLIGGTLPSGMTLSVNGMVSGTPSINGKFSFTVQATDATGKIVSTVTYELEVAPGPTGTPKPLSPELMDFMLNNN